MSPRTRYFVIASVLVLVLGIGAGVLAFYIGLPQALVGSGTPKELQYVPANATVVAYANVHDVMTSDLRQRIRRSMPIPENGRQEFQQETGIDIETDIDRIVACLDSSPAGDVASGRRRPRGGLFLARGRFNEVKIEALMRDHGAAVEQYKGKRVIARQAPSGPLGEDFALTFMEPGLAAVGNAVMVRSAIDLIAGGANVTSNEAMMSQIRGLDSSNAWAVGHFEDLRASAALPEAIASQIPPITWFALSGQIDTGIRGVARAEVRDEAAATNLRDVVRGFVALAKMQAGNKPEIQSVVQSLELGGTAKTVTLSFAVPGELFDSLNTGPQVRPQPQR